MITMNYRQLLKAELDERVAKNQNYSLRAMALQLKLSSGMLSSILNGKRNLSAKRALEIAKTLKFNKRKSDYFVALVQYDTVKSDEVRAELLETLFHLAPKDTPQELDVDIFKLISDWYHVPVLQMTHTTQPEINKDTVAEYLGISTKQAADALDRLFRLGLLTTGNDGKIKTNKSQVVTNSPKPNEALRHFHRQMMERAILSLETQTPKEKFIGSETFAFDDQDLEKANEILEECFAKIVRLAAKRQNKKHVYHLGIQLFRLNKDLA
ncbi:TIGR02147 family protein [Bdellovibrio sp. HCB209]|uniref:TIGR02147 family protein n=1 Tax=Bdellovibrio sp. HCB209 TaxID=3394354 RepID=UPI0039B4118D